MTPVPSVLARVEDATDDARLKMLATSWQNLLGVFREDPSSTSVFVNRFMDEVIVVVSVMMRKVKDDLFADDLNETALTLAFTLFEMRRDEAKDVDHWACVQLLLRLEATMAMVEVYKDKSLPKASRLAVQPMLVARGMLRGKNE